MKTYGQATITQRIQRLLIPKKWYKVYIPLNEGTHEEEQ